MNRLARLASLAALFTAACAGLRTGAEEEGEELMALSFAGEVPPELEVAPGAWFNAKKAPRLADLRGKVVWLEFSFST